MNDNQLTQIKKFNKDVGNIYNGSLYLSLLSLLTEQDIDLRDQSVGMFAYGSGASSEYFTLTIQPQYQTWIPREAIDQHIQSRKPVTYEVYIALMSTFAERERALEFTANLEWFTTQRFVLKSIIRGHRQYQNLNLLK
jgi:3-hydroxy-3-methylglutaryl CoA synthase